MVFTAHGYFFEPYQVTEAYKIVKDRIKASGESEDYAICVVSLIRVSRFGKRLKNRSGISETPSELADEIMEESRSPKFWCGTFGQIIVFTGYFIIFSFCCTLCYIRFAMKPKPRVLDIAMDQLPNKNGSVV
jgi:hypothetical protein